MRVDKTKRGGRRKEGKLQVKEKVKGDLVKERKGERKGGERDS